MDKKYWEDYYAAQGPSNQPSNFARYCASRYSEEYGHLFDIGCGNGRDSLFFASQSIPCTGIDQSQVAIEQNRAKAAGVGLDVAFEVGDFSAIVYDEFVAGAYSIYSRFTLHAINRDEEARLLAHLNAAKNLKYVLIEARTIRDGLYGQGTEVGAHEFVTTHYRRFIDPDALAAQLLPTFEVLESVEAQGFARTDTEDPCLLRLIAKRR